MLLLDLLSNASPRRSLLRCLRPARRYWERVVWAHVFDDCGDGFLYEVDKRRRIDSDPERHDDEWNHVRPLAPLQIPQAFFLRVLDVAEEHSLIEPEHVARVQN